MNTAKFIFKTAHIFGMLFSKKFHLKYLEKNFRFLLDNLLNLEVESYKTQNKYS